MASTEKYKTIQQQFTSGGVGTFGDRLSAGEDFEDGEERSSERRELGELVSDLFTGLLNFATLGVEGDDFPGVVSDTLVLFRQNTSKHRQFYQNKIIGSNSIIIDNFSK